VCPSQPTLSQCFRSHSSRESLSSSANYYADDIAHRIVARIFSKYPSQVRQTKEFIGPIVKERFAKMEEFGGAWDDAPVRIPISTEAFILSS